MTYATPFIRFVAPARQRSVPVLNPLRALFVWVATVFGLWLDRGRLRWELRRLCEADDHLLRDIGLTRSDVFRASRMSLWP